MTTIMRRVPGTMETKQAKALAKATAREETKQAKVLAKEEKRQATLKAKEETKQAKATAKEEKRQATLRAKEENRRAKAVTLTPVMPETSMPEDRYTAQILRTKYHAFRAYYLSELADQAELGTRMTNMPEHISENIVKFIVRNHLGTESFWAKHVNKPGDLWSPTELVQECKCFMSNGPLSFGPEKRWNAIYFLDMRKWTADEIVLYRTTLSPSDERWQSIRMSAEGSRKKKGGELWRDQCETRGARPHIGWEALHPQIDCTEVYRGTFEGIFSKGTSLEAISSTTGSETALPARA